MISFRGEVNSVQVLSLLQRWQTGYDYSSIQSEAGVTGLVWPIGHSTSGSEVIFLSASLSVCTKKLHEVDQKTCDRLNTVLWKCLRKYSEVAILSKCQSELDLSLFGVDLDYPAWRFLQSSYHCDISPLPKPGLVQQT